VKSPATLIILPTKRFHGRCAVIGREGDDGTVKEARVLVPARHDGVKHEYGFSLAAFNKLKPASYDVKLFLDPMTVEGRLRCALPRPAARAS